MSSSHPIKKRYHSIPFPKRSPVDIYNRKVSRGSNDAVYPSDDEILESFKEHVQLAMMIELSTIPLYLYPHYSVQGDSDPAKDTILGIVIQEMVHLSLAGNILRSVGGYPKLYHAEHFPRYPMLMADRLPGLVLHLMPLNWVMIGIAREVEKRSYAEPPPIPLGPGPVIIQDTLDDEYTSLGEFYRELQNFVTQHLTDASFQAPGALEDQISTNDVHVNPSDGLITIHSAQDAITAMQTIIDQGEGVQGQPSPDSHIVKFETMQEPNSLYPVPPENPRTSDYILNYNAVAVSNVFNAAYCFLILTIENIYIISVPEKRSTLSANIRHLMGGVLGVIAPWLCKTPIGNGLNAAPTFEFWDYTRNGQSKYDALQQLQDLKKDLPASILQDPDLKSAWDTIDTKLNPLIPLLLSQETAC